MMSETFVQYYNDDVDDKTGVSCMTAALLYQEEWAFTGIDPSTATKKINCTFVVATKIEYRQFA